MLVASAVLAVDVCERLLKLLYILIGAGIQGLLDDRLFSTAAAPKRLLQRAIAAQSRIDFDHPVRSGQDGNQAIVQLVGRCVFDALLRNHHLLTHGREQLALPQQRAERGQAGARRSVSGDRSGHGRLVHGDSPPVAFGLLTLQVVLSPSSWQIPCEWAH